jgi:hypothetical protein
MSFFSLFFGRMEDPVKEEEVKEEIPMEVDRATRKRGRLVPPSVSTVATLATPHSLVSADGSSDVIAEPPVKRRKGAKEQAIPVLQEEVQQEDEPEEEKEVISPLALLPEDVLAHCLSFCSGVESRFAVQCTSQQFRRISNTDEMMIGIAVGGDKKTGLHGIISETDTPESSSDHLLPYARAGNLEAIYMYVLFDSFFVCRRTGTGERNTLSPNLLMLALLDRLGIIKSYCNQDVDGGIVLLRMASDQGYVRASYALGLVLRDTHGNESGTYMKIAADAGYIPALQEILSARTMKAKYGEPQADELRHFLDPLCLNRLLARHYVRSAGLRDLNTSHCWNPLCGRWAFKATMGLTQNNSRARRHAQHRWAAARRSTGLESFTSAMMGNTTARAAIDNSTTTSTIQTPGGRPLDIRVSRMKMCSRCCRAKYCSKLCQVYDWRSGRHKMECQYL